MFTPIENSDGKTFRQELNERLDNDRGDIEKSIKNIEDLAQSIDEAKNKIGEVAQPPCFRLHASEFTYVGAAGWTHLNLDWIDFDFGDGWKQDRYIAPVEGWYEFTVSVAMTAENLIFRAGIMKNGEFVTKGAFVNASTTEACATVSDLIYMNGVSDYITGVIAYSASNGKTSTNSYETFMYGKLVRRK